MRPVNRPSAIHETKRMIVSRIGGKMRTVRMILPAFLIAVLSFAAYAQEESPPTLLPETAINANPYVPGEQMLSFKLGAFFPTKFYNLYAGGSADTNLKVGVGFGIAYDYVVAQGFSVGGEVEGSTCSTTAGSSFFLVPFTAKAAWYFVRMPFEIVPSVSTGLTITRYNSYTHFDPILKAGASFLWRQSSSWSFGLDAQVWSVWQFYTLHPEYNRLGIFVNTRLTAVYHL